MIDYPKNYSYSIDDKGAISFEKVVDYPHRTNSWIFINKNLLDREELIALNTMKLGEKRIIKKEGTTIPDNFNVYERLPNKMFGDKEAKSFVNKNIWEGDQLYLYLIENRDKTLYLFGGFINDYGDSEDNITYAEFNSIISTFRILD